MSEKQKNNNDILIELQAFQVRISVLQEIANAIAQCLRPKEIIESLKQNIKWLLDFDICNLFLKNAKDEFDSFTLFGRPVSKSVFSLKGENLIDKAIRTKHPQLFTNTKIESNSIFNNVIVIPLVSEREVLGTINFIKNATQDYDYGDLRLCNLLSFQIAAAFKNAQLFESLELAHLELRKAENLREDLINIIVHDLRNPLNVMLNSLEMAKLFSSNEVNAKQTKWFGSAEKAGKRMVNMIDDLLDVSRTDGKKLVLNLKPTKIENILNDKIDFYHSQAEREQKTLSLRPNSHLPQIIADERIVRRILDNLIGNAFKYTSKGGKIELSTNLSNDFVEISISDDGQGIPKKYHEKIFDKFAQVLDENNQPLRKGNGLGLAFCKLAAETHNGKIRVHSEINEGSSFVLSLPIKQPNLSV